MNSIKILLIISYINAIVQCLCHTEQVALYILRKDYEIDIRNIKNALLDYPNCFQQLTGFKVTKLFVQLFQSLWNNSPNSTLKLLYDFKAAISNLNRQYSGNEQNDAQEFLLFLMNTIHDELNLSIAHRCRQRHKVITNNEQIIIKRMKKRSFRSMSIVYFILEFIIFYCDFARINSSCLARIYGYQSKYNNIHI